MLEEPPTTFEEKLAQLQELRKEAAHEETSAAKQHARGKLSARERIDKLLDPGSFQEIDSFARHQSREFGLEARRPWGDAVITGRGLIDGRPVCLFSQDFAIFGGSVGEVVSQKICKVMDLAGRIGCPVVGINDSAGARIQEGIASLVAYGEIFFRNVALSGVVPQVSLIMGPCAGGAAYSPALTDFVFMVRDTSHMLVTGPEVIRAVTGEDATLEELGGALTHATKSGVADLAAADEETCLEDCRQLLSYLPPNNMSAPPRVDTGDDPDRTDPDLGRIVPDDPYRGYDIREVVWRVVDSGELFEIKEFHAPNMVVGFARLNGHAIGVIASQPSHLGGALDIDACVKTARFVRFCDAFNLPIVSFCDVPGMLPGTRQEVGGIIRHGAKLVFALADLSVPRLTVVTRKAYGGSWMLASHINADYTVAWPNAEVAVMGSEAAVSVLHRRELAEATDRQARWEELVESYRSRFANPYVAAERGFLDDVVAPAETRPKLVRALESLQTKQRPAPTRKHGQIPL